PVMLTRIFQRNATEDGDAMVHALAVELDMRIAVALEGIGWEDAVEHLGFLQAENVRLLLLDQALDQPDARAHRIDVPRCNLQPLCHFRRLAPTPRQTKGPRSGGMERGP